MDKIASAETVNSYTRLHITPFDSAILPSIIPAAIRPLAKNISFHTLQTFPERNYGFVDLPAMEAEKVKRKLKGSILRGTKVKIEEARVDKKIPIADGDEVESKEKAPAKKEKSKKRTRETETIQAVELHDRKVKRGWTDPDAPARLEKKKKSKDKKEGKESIRSKYTTEPECLFRAAIPENVAANAPASVRLEKKKRGKGKEVLVHEFAKTEKFPTFLRDSKLEDGKGGVAEYVEEKGWVDESGEVIEPPAKKKKTSKVAATAVEEPKAKSVSDTSDDESSSGFSSNEDSDDSLAAKERLLKSAPTKIAQSLPIEDDSTSSSGTSSSSSSDSDSDSDSASDSDAAISTSTPITPSLPIPTSKATEPPQVHPLEALYKRPKPNPTTNNSTPLAQTTETAPTFSFFGAGDDSASSDEEEDENSKTGLGITRHERDDGDDKNEELRNNRKLTIPIPPMTPFTEKDFARRGMRSAAPTPDTAHPSRFQGGMRWLPEVEEMDIDVDAEGGVETPLKSKKGQDAAAGAGGEGEEEVDEWEKTFYEKRGEYNRAWKKNVREASKAKRRVERSGRKM